MNKIHKTFQECSIIVDNMQLKTILSYSHDKTDQLINPLLVFTMHTHPFAELFVCCKDRILINTPYGMETLNAYEVMIIPPNLPHRCITDIGDQVWFALPFTCTKISEQSDIDLYDLFSPCIEETEILHFRNCDIFVDTIESIFQSIKAGKKATLLHFVYLLTDLLEKHEEAVPETNIEYISGNSDMERLEYLDQYINNRFMMELSVEKIAATLFISTRQLNRISIKRYGKTLYQVIIEKRIKAAEQLLLNTDLTTEEIAYAVGFGSRANFFREFRKKCGVTPTEYRKDVKEN